MKDTHLPQVQDTTEVSNLPPIRPRPRLSTLGSILRFSEVERKYVVQSTSSSMRRFSLGMDEFITLGEIREQNFAGLRSTNRMRSCIERPSFSVQIGSLNTRNETIFPDPLHPPRKSIAQFHKELNILSSLGVSTDGVPTELAIFKERPPMKTGMSVMDLWGAEHAKLAIRKLGCYDTFKAMEERDKRLSLQVENNKGAKYNPRMMDDLSNMKAMNSPMARSETDLDFHPAFAAEKVSQKSNSKRVRELNSIVTSCEQLSKDNKKFKETLTPVLESPKGKKYRMKRSL